MKLITKYTGHHFIIYWGLHCPERWFVRIRCTEEKLLEEHPKLGHWQVARFNVARLAVIDCPYPGMQMDVEVKGDGDWETPEHVIFGAIRTTMRFTAQHSDVLLAPLGVTQSEVVKLIAAEPGAHPQPHTMIFDCPCPRMSLDKDEVVEREAWATRPPSPFSILEQPGEFQFTDARFHIENITPTEDNFRPVKKDTPIKTTPAINHTQKDSPPPIGYAVASA